VVSFSDTDTAGIVHFACFFRYMEDCEHAFLRSLGHCVHVTEDDGAFRGFPRVKATAEFQSPLRFEDEVEVALTVVEMRRSTLVYAFEVRRAGDAQVAAVGSTTVVCAGRASGEKGMGAVPIPEGLRHAITQRMSDA
jgi:YbgC/YbaW family acyl-CoA thioester hydrolase